MHKIWQYWLFAAVTFLLGNGLAIKITYAQDNEVLFPPLSLSVESKTTSPAQPGQAPSQEISGSLNSETFEIPPIEASAIGVEEQQTPEERKKAIRGESFNAALTGLFPMQPDEIRELLKYYDKTEEAIKTPFYDGPEPSVAVVTVSLDPGALPPTIKVAAG